MLTNSLRRATSDEGLDRFRELPVVTYSAHQGLSNLPTGPVLAARDGSIWFGTRDGLDRMDKGQVAVYGVHAKAANEIAVSGLPDRGLESLFEDSRGRVWVSSFTGVGYLEHNRYVSTPISGGTVHAITEDRAGNIWIADQTLGLLRLSPGNEVQEMPWTAFGRKDPATALVADPSRGGVWIGFFQGGIAYFDGGQIRASYGAADGLGTGRVNDLRFGSRGTLWAATEGGLSRLRDGRIATLTSKNGLHCDAVHWTIEDDDHSVWMMTPCGLARVARSDLDAWASDPKRTVTAAVFDSSDGLTLLAVAGGYSPRVAKSTDGKLWFWNGNGVGVIDPRRLPFNKLPPPVQIEQIAADRKTYDAHSQAGVHLPPRSRDLEIDYTALSFAAPEKIRFRYKLEGHDANWQDAGNRRQAFYNDLPPHNYRFRVMAANNSGVWNEAGAFLDFSVAPAYYQTTWFRWSSVAAFLALLAALYQLRLHQMKQHLNMRMEERVNERTRIARDLHDTLLQGFQGVLLKFHTVTYMLPEQSQAQKKLEDVIEQARQAITEGRDAVQGLRSSTLMTNDLALAIGTIGERLAADHSRENRPGFRIEVQGASVDLAPLVRDEVYRIAVEALRNAFLHAQAKRIEVEIHYDKRQLRMRVRDNGKGIDQKVLDAGALSGHHGLPGMHERAALVKGKLSVWSEPNDGTELELTVPASVAYVKSPVASHSSR